MGNNIKAIILEEHNEQFIALRYAINKKWIKPSHNLLIHIDEHADMGSPYLNQSLHDIINNSDIEFIKSFTYEELNIANFIMPSVYLNVFSSVFWVRHTNRYVYDDRFVYSLNNKGKTLISGSLKNTPIDLNNNCNYQSFKFYSGDIDNIFESQDVILDIDLDYFSCAGEPRQLGNVSIEITEKEYESFMNSKYHLIKYINIPRVSCIKKEDKFYYVFNDFTEYPENKLKVNIEIILERIEKMINSIKNKNISPSMIVICKSMKSRFTPVDQVDFILKNVIQKLTEIFDINVININDIY